MSQYVLHVMDGVLVPVASAVVVLITYYVVVGRRAVP